MEDLQSSAVHILHHQMFVSLCPHMIACIQAFESVPFVCNTVTLMWSAGDVILIVSCSEQIQMYSIKAVL